jgi:hypothetical protein
MSATMGQPVTEAGKRLLADWQRDPKELWTVEQVVEAILAIEREATEAEPAGSVPEPDILPRAEYARLLGIEDIARLIVEGWDHGFPVSDGDSERQLIDRLRDALAPAADAGEGAGGPQL